MTNYVITHIFHVDIVVFVDFLHLIDLVLIFCNIAFYLLVG